MPSERWPVFPFRRCQIRGRRTLGSGSRDTASRHVTRPQGMGNGEGWDNPQGSLMGPPCQSYKVSPESHSPHLGRCPLPVFMTQVSNGGRESSRSQRLRGEQGCNIETLTDGDRGDKRESRTQTGEDTLRKGLVTPTLCKQSLVFPLATASFFSGVHALGSMLGSSHYYLCSRTGPN